MNKFLCACDNTALHVIRRISSPIARLALFIVFFWFGFLKVINASPASELVDTLLSRTMPWMPAGPFLQGFGVFECAIGIMFLFPRLDRLVIILFLIHMVTTAGPLVLLPHLVWTAPFVPTLEGQYIIKNIALIAIALGIASHLHPLTPTKREPI